MVTGDFERVREALLKANAGPMSSDHPEGIGEHRRAPDNAQEGNHGNQ